MAKTTSRRGKAEDASAAPVIGDDVQDAEILNEEPLVEDVTEAEPVAEMAEGDTVRPSEPAPEPNSAPVKQVENRGPGFLPLVLGGAVAAGLGFGGAWAYLPRNDGAIATLEAEVAALKSAPDAAAIEAEVSARLATQSADQQAALGALQDRVGAVESTLSTATSDAGTLSDLAARLETLESRVKALEVGGATASPGALAGLAGDLDALRADLAAQAATVQGLADTAANQLEQTRASAAEIEQNALDTARASALRVALARVQAAMVSGAPYALDLPDLAEASGSALPNALTSPAETGVPTLLALQEAFPDASRAALATARAEGVSGEDESSVVGFLRTMFDVRSVEPREGGTTDAILSRAEAALTDGRLADTMAEIASLPEVVRAEFGSWSGLAQTRADALAAVETLSQSLSEN